MYSYDVIGCNVGTYAGVCEAIYILTACSPGFAYHQEARKNDVPLKLVRIPPKQLNLHRSSRVFRGFARCPQSFPGSHLTSDYGTRKW